MGYPLPGMNPYLENPALWSEIHSWLIVELARTLNPLLKPHYRAAIEQRTYLDSVLIGVPDVLALSSSPSYPQPSSVTATLTHQPQAVTLPMPEEVKETFLEIRHLSSEKVITVIEVLSPKNKRRGEGQDQYLKKRLQVLSSMTHLVEIDLLRSGPCLPMTGADPSDYRILISRAEQRPVAELYTFNLRDPIPPFTLPLENDVPEPAIELYALLSQIYDQAALDLVIDYAQQPIPPLPPQDFAWLQSQVKSPPHQECSL